MRRLILSILGLSICGTAVPTARGQGAEPAAGGTADDSPELMIFKDIQPVVVVAAGKREQTQQQAAASVSVVTAEEIELFGYRSLADVLRGQRSFYIHSDGLNQFAGVRGFLRPGEWNARILVLVDGRPTRENVYGQTHLDQDFAVPVEAIKRVEVVRGPGSALYGSNAVFGVVNVVTKDGADVDGTLLRLQGGTKETGRASLLYGKKFDSGFDVLAGFSAFTTQGDRDIKYDRVDDAAHNYGHVRNFDYEGADTAFVKIRKGDVTFQGDVASRQKDNRSATYLASFEDPGSMNEARADATLRIDHEIGEGQSFHAMAYYGHYRYRQSWTYAADSAAAPPTPAYRYVTASQDDWVGEELHYAWQVTKTIHLLAGAEGSQTLFTRQTDHDSLHGTVLDIPASTNTWSLFGEAEWKAMPWLSLMGGLRMDHVQRFGTSFSPRFAAIVTPTKADAVKLLYGRAFRAPNLYETLYASPGYNAPNPNLRPEVVDTFELVWERQNLGGWRTSVGGYVWKMSDAMENFQSPAGVLQTRNGPTLWAHGLEAEVERKWDNGGRVRAYGTFTRAEHQGVTLSHSPEFIVGTSAAIPVVGKKTFLAVEPQFVGRMKSDLNEYTKPTFITNVVFTSKDLAGGWTFQAGVYNLFAGSARLPRDGAFNQVQPTLNYPGTELLVSLSRRF